MIKETQLFPNESAITIPTHADWLLQLGPTAGTKIILVWKA